MYQDLVTAYFMAEAVVDNWSLVVDRKSFEGDVFDDISIVASNRSLKIQLKSSLNDDRELELVDLSTNRRGTRLDVLIESAKRDAFSAGEYRLCATWAPPSDSKLLQFLETVDGGQSFRGVSSCVCRLRPEVIWPLTGSPAISEVARHTREEFHRFCSLFLLEIACPRASLNLLSPGPLENLLLVKLTDEVGVGTFPNDQLQPLDTAATLVHFAQLARTKRLQIMPADILRQLRIRTDYGRIAQQFPINRSLLVGQVAKLEALSETAERYKITLLTGEPGAGKSWLLAELADKLTKKGALVARHYCYLEPTDREMQRRITTRIMFGNLTAELLDSRPDLAASMRPLYNASSETCEQLLGKAAENGPVFLIVDGIDHISRVFAQSRALSCEDIDIVEQLAALRLPENVHLVVGSQPGNHLAPLSSDGHEVRLPEWGRQEIQILAAKTTLTSRLASLGLESLVSTVLGELHTRSEGNPLYATFVCRQLLSILSSGSAVDPVQVIREIPVREGDLSRYYGYLLGRVEDHHAVVLAEALALLDFGVTESELRSIFPAEAHRVPAALAFLEPILEKLPTQGGIRIYHESFRRFVLDRLREQGASIQARLDPVRSWLQNRGFFSDPKAYRFLLPVLRRAERDADVVAHVGPTFVSDSLSEGQSPTAIAYNLMIAAETAADLRDWSALVRINELQRANATYKSERLGDLHWYATAFKSVRGAQALNERLLFEGRPTYGFEAGLLLCKVCDDAGVIPPWREYLRLSRSAETSPFGERDVGEAWFQGVLRTRGLDAGIRILVDWTKGIEDNGARHALVWAAIRQLGMLFGVPALEQKEVQSLPAWVVTIANLEAARLKSRSGEPGAAQVAEEIVGKSNDLEMIAEAVKLGASASEALSRCPSLGSFNLNTAHYPDDETTIRRWRACLTVSAMAHSDELDPEIQRVRGQGWFRLWLEFAVRLARAQALALNTSTDAKSQALAALRMLCQDTRPFVGSPRACDLYPLHSSIRESISEALELLAGDRDMWSEAIGVLVQISEGTSTWLQNEESGPLDTEALVNVLSQFSARPQLTDLILPTIQTQLDRWAARGGYYSSLGLQELHLAHIFSELLQSDIAENHWKKACVYLAAYGYRKDSTVFELLDPLATIGADGPSLAADALRACQPLIHAVGAHTDGRGTDFAAVSWFSALCRARPAEGLVLLSQALAADGGVLSWRLESALEEGLESIGTSASPLTTFYLWSTVLSEETIAGIEYRLEILDSLFQLYPTIATRLVHLLAAQVQGDNVKVDPDGTKQIIDFAADHGITIESSADSSAPKDERREYAVDRSGGKKVEPELPPFPPTATPLQLMNILRQVRVHEFPDPDRFVNAFGYRLLDLVQAGSVDDAVSLLKCFARSKIFSSGAEQLADMGTGFSLRGDTRLAALSFAWAYIYSRGGGGWFALGGSQYIHWFTTAVGLARETAFSALAEEIVRMIDGESYVAGITRHLVELFARVGEIDRAYSIWWSAYEVIQRRVPRLADVFSPFSAYNPKHRSALSLDGASVFLLIARLSHPDQRRKLSAIAGLAQVVRATPEIAVGAIREFLGGEPGLTATLSVLAVLLDFEQAPYPVSRACVDGLGELASSDKFGLCQMSRDLLERIGSAVAQFPAKQRIVLPVRVLPKLKIDAVLSLDYGERAQMVGKSLWAEAPDIIAARFDELWEVERNRDMDRERLAVIQQTAQRKLPRAPVLQWSREIYETALHEVLNHLDEKLGSEGTPEIALLSEVARNAAPNVRLHIGRWHSRVPRPSIPLPSKQEADRGVPELIPPPGEYTGWYRCGYFEEESVLKQGQALADCESILTVAQGMAIKRPGTRSNTREYLPFGEGDLSAWFEIPTAKPLHGANGPLVGLAFTHDFFGVYPLLTLAPSVAGRLGLKPGPEPGQLQLQDLSGAPAVLFRQWHLRPFGEMLGEAAPQLAGCDLIIRPDLWDELRGIIGDQRLTALMFQHYEPLTDGPK
jgi:hypothetical protein